MPLPTPNGEDESKFISRCMGDSHMNEKFPDKEQRAAVCYRQFRGNREMRPLLNREFKMPDDGWYQIAPYGLWPHEASGTVQLLDEKAIKTMVERFNSESKAENFGGVLIDFDHFSYDPDKPSEAAGWIQAMDARDDGLWGKVRWTDLGQKRVQNGEYRFISPVWLTTDGEAVGKDAFRPLRLDGAGLTNQPNLRGMVPLSNSRRPAGAGAADSEQRKKGKTMQSVMTRLGLSADASEDSAAKAVDALLNRKTEDGAKIVALETQVKDLTAENTALKAENAKHLDTQAETDLAAIANRFTKENFEKVRATIKKQLLANRAETLAIYEALQPLETKDGSNTQVVNRNATQQPKGGAGGEGDLGKRTGEAVKKLAKDRSTSAHVVTNREAFANLATWDPDAYKAWREGGMPAIIY